MSTAISDLYNALRHLLGDRDSTVQLYQDSSLLIAVQTMVQMGKVSAFELSTDHLSITPAITTPNDLALLLYHTVLSFVASEPDSQSYRTRAVSETTGANREFIWQLTSSIHELQSGTMFDSWQSFGAWIQGVAGVDLVTFLSPLSSISGFAGVSLDMAGSRLRALS